MTCFACDRRPAPGTSDSESVARTSTAGASSAAFVDDFGDTLHFEPPATRVVSLNPATTEILFAIGAGSRVVGRTHWDLYPDSAKRAPDLGNGIRPNVESVLATRPDLVVLYASADNRDAARTLRIAGVRTFAVKLDRIADFRRTTRLLGRFLGDTVRAATVVDSVDGTLERVRTATRGLRRPSVFWKAWDSPLLAIAGGSFMTELVDIAGGRNIYAHVPTPSPQVTLEDVVRRNPDVIITGPGGLEVLRTQGGWRALEAVRRGRFVVVDTMLVGRPSVRLGEAALSIARVLHPGAIP